MLELQKDFLNYIFSGNSPDFISSKDADLRFNIYKNTIIESYANAIVETFQMLKSMLGEDYLRQEGKRFAYSIKNVADLACLDYWGEGFINHIDIECKKHDLSYIGELAKYEWNVHLASISESKFLDIKYEFSKYSANEMLNLSLTINNSVRFLKFNFDILKLIEFYEHKITELTINYCPTFLIITKYKGEMRTIPVNANIWNCFIQLSEGVTLAAVNNINSLESTLRIGLENNLFAKVHLN